jgi:hypothetical protein
MVHESWWVNRSIEQTFEDRGHKIVTLTRFFGKAGGEDSVVTEDHGQDADIAASM